MVLGDLLLRFASAKAVLRKVAQYNISLPIKKQNGHQGQHGYIVNFYILILRVLLDYLTMKTYKCRY